MICQAGDLKGACGLVTYLDVAQHADEHCDVAQHGFSFHGQHRSAYIRYIAPRGSTVVDPRQMVDDLRRIKIKNFD